MSFLFTSSYIVVRGAMRLAASIIYETKTIMLEIKIDAAGDEYYLLNCQFVAGLPVGDAYTHHTAKIIKEFNKHRDAMQSYAITQDIELYYKLKKEIDK